VGRAAARPSGGTRQSPETPRAGYCREARSKAAREGGVAHVRTQGLRPGRCNWDPARRRWLVANGASRKASGRNCETPRRSLRGHEEQSRTTRTKPARSPAGERSTAAATPNAAQTSGLEHPAAPARSGPMGVCGVSCTEIVDVDEDRPARPRHQRLQARGSDLERGRQSQKTLAAPAPIEPNPIAKRPPAPKLGHWGWTLRMNPRVDGRSGHVVENIPPT
jgi:hypothetical protein